MPLEGQDIQDVKGLPLRMPGRKQRCASTPFFYAMQLYATLQIEICCAHFTIAVKHFRCT